MARRSRLALTLLALAPLAACSPDRASAPTPALAPTPVQPRAITYGFVDGDATYANVGAMILLNRANGLITPLCTGTLVSPTVFLTAAHCTAFYQSLPAGGYGLYVSFSSPIPFGPRTDLKAIRLIAVTGFVTNPGYNQAQNDPGDIAVLFVPGKETKGITPAALPTAGLLDRLQASGALKDGLFTSVGYGAQDRVTGGGTPYFTDANPVPRMYSFGGFDALTPAFLRLSGNPATGDGGTCYGDSGGPNFLKLGGQNVLVATTVTGDAVCRATNVDYRLDTPAARAFLAPYVRLP